MRTRFGLRNVLTINLEKLAKLRGIMWCFRYKYKKFGIHLKHDLYTTRQILKIMSLNIGFLKNVRILLQKCQVSEFLHVCTDDVHNF